jgi:hypothetical protein
MNKNKIQHYIKNDFSRDSNQILCYEKIVKFLFSRTCQNVLPILKKPGLANLNPKTKMRAQILFFV